MGPIGYKRLKGSLKQFGVCKGDECVASFRGGNFSSLYTTRAFDVLTEQCYTSYKRDA